MKVNASIVLYHTPVAELNNVLSVLLSSDVINRIYLIDNSEGPLRLPVEDSRVEYRFSGKNLGFGRGHNIAIRESIRTGVPFHLIMNSDVMFHAEHIWEMLQYMEAHADVACMMPNVQFPTGKPQRLCKLLPTPMDLLGRRFLPEAWIRKRNARYELVHTGYDHIMNVPALSGCFLLCRTDALQEAGLFDERFFLYCEDIDLTRRMHRVGKTLFYPGITISHDFRRSSYRNLRLMWTHIRSACLYFDKYGWISDEERDKVNEECING
ncbi:MAG: glycosyltransferase family 2 protein [Paludibacteraceae bacterium]|nr:glycosyltransferase family 2 protein [Paludibacteraceae bacterium]MBR4547531.1 glycosyltransferase family 2 protein [Paludibacteraceae bacterium]MBR6146562.1 glycosyltransferase family 2 protein [Paludibacteraceae bacterium]